MSLLKQHKSYSLYFDHTHCILIIHLHFDAYQYVELTREKVLCFVWTRKFKRIIHLFQEFKIFYTKMTCLDKIIRKQIKI